jgi:hypothetical protein
MSRPLGKFFLKRLFLPAAGSCKGGKEDKKAGRRQRREGRQEGGKAGRLEDGKAEGNE